MTPILRAVPSDPIPEYPFPKDMRLDGHFFVKWQFNRWLNSRLATMATYEVQGIARTLFDIAQNQTPIGTLPDSDMELARLLRLELHYWIELRARPMGPLHNWTLCQFGDGSNEMRLMHPIVLAMVRDVIDRREARELSKEQQAERKRMERLRANLAKIGCNDEVLEDVMLMSRMDQWLAKNWNGNRTRSAHEAALIEATRQGWLRVRPV
jgi:hypothetical protein